MIKKSLQLISNMGVRYTLYRIRHELEKRLGILKKRHPVNPLTKSFISLSDWRKETPAFLIPEKEKFTIAKTESASLKEQAQRILNGEICFFSHEWKNLGLNYDWITNPDSSYQYDISKHWSEISDLNPANGDIKYVWEKSRFSYLLTIIRNDYNFEEDHAEFVFSEIESWINGNPINQGPNWRCSQEISLRIINWSYALVFYKNSAALTEERWNKIQHVIYWSLHHVYHHIDFSRIAVRNNHAITETLMLTISELLFPFIPETKLWAKNGRKWFEEEVAYQVYEDGTFLQFSMNYHRVVIQLLSLGISLTEIHQKRFSNTIYDRAYKSLNFLYQCLQEENGHLPNYGANDGALFFPLSSTNYRDYRPQLNALHSILTGNFLYFDAYLTENAAWVQGGNEAMLLNSTQGMPALQKKYGALSFPIGGFYLLRETNSFTFIRCGNHKDRPSHADNLHVDLWLKGENVLKDSGTYKYNTKKEYQDYFTGTAGHNTVMVNDYSQMLKGSRFIWYYWTQANFAHWKEENGQFIFEGEISAFRFLNKKATHSRRIVKEKDKNEWLVIDQVMALPDKKKSQIWHYDQSALEFTAREYKIIKPEAIKSYYSDYYGVFEEGNGISYPFDAKISTTIKVKN